MFWAMRRLDSSGLILVWFLVWGQGRRGGESGQVRKHMAEEKQMARVEKPPLFFPCTIDQSMSGLGRMQPQEERNWPDV